MRNRSNFKKVLLISIASAMVSLAGSAQSDWNQKLHDLRDKGTPKSRLELIDKAMKEAPEAERPLFLMERALIYESQGRFDDALAAYEEVLKKGESIAEYAHLFSARLNLGKGNDQKALFHFEKILELSPNLQLQNEAQFAVAKLSLKAGKATEARKLLAGLEKKLRSDPNYGDLLWELSRAERKVGNNKAFCKWIKKLFITQPGSSLFANWGSDLAANQFDGKPTGCQLDDEDRRRRIKNLQWSGMSSKAWTEIENLRTLAGQDPFEVTMLEALYHLHEGEVSKALDLLLPHHDKMKNSFTYLTTLATTAARAGEGQLAVGSYYSAYQLSPKSQLGRQALYQSAFLSYQFQDYDGASRRFQEFMKVYSNSGLVKDARWHLAWIRYLRGDFVGASKAFLDLKNEKPGKSRRRKAVASSSGQDRLTYWMAMADFRLGRFTEAKSQFENLVKTGGQGYYALASLQRLKKIEGFIVKPIRPIRSEQTRQFSRFSTEFMLTMDEFNGASMAEAVKTSDVAVTVEGESEETLALNPLSSETELGTENASDEAPAESVANNDSEEETGSESKLTSTNPVLSKRLARARDLRLLGLNDWAKWDLYDVERRTTSKSFLNDLISEYESIGQFHRSANIAQNAFARLRGKGGIDGVKTVWMHAYPQAYKEHVNKWSGQFKISSDLVWGIMKAESSYKRDIVSPVGAIGLMQIMPNTGEKLSGLLKESGFVPQNLFEPEVSIRLGSKYLQRLSKQFDQNYALVAAGYNAGPHRVHSWLASFGQLDLDEFIEHIPFLETRNYVKRVVSNAWVYNHLYGGSHEFFGQLSEPLKLRFQAIHTVKETWEDI